MPQGLKKLSALNGCTSENTRKNLVLSGITVEDVYKAFKEDKLQGLINLLQCNANFAGQVTQNNVIPKKNI